MSNVLILLVALHSSQIQYKRDCEAITESMVDLTVLEAKEESSVSIDYVLKGIKNWRLTCIKKAKK